MIDPTQSVIDWLEKRIKSDADRSQEPVQGFGPGGNFTVWLPAPRPATHLVFKNGEPAYEVGSDVLDDPAIQRARNAALSSLKDVGPHQLQIVAVAFYAYTAAILRRNYTLSDQDLTFLLGGSAKWHAAVVAHLCGGRDYLRALEEYAPSFFTSSELATSSIPPAKSDVPEPRPPLRYRLMAAWRVIRGQ